MKLHEYQAKELLSRFGVLVADGEVTSDPAEAQAIAVRLGGKVVVKAQVLMGGRGKAGGVKLFDDPSEVAAFAKRLLGKRLVSIQNPSGMIVNKLLVVKQIDIAEEFYLSVLIDRHVQKLVVMISAKGGVEIEEVAATSPDAIVRLHVDPAWGLADFELRAALAKAEIPVAARRQMADMIKRLVKAFYASDADLIEINPCAMTTDGKLMAADAKVAIDDNALWRHPEYSGTSSEAAEDPLEAEAARRGIAYVRLGGDIGIIGNGAGLVMCSLDEVTAAGGRPANFLDVGGGAQAERVKSCVELILMDPNVKGLLINIFGGITRGDEVAKGIVQSMNELHVRIPVVARIEGTAAEEGRRLLARTRLHPADTMQEAARLAVSLAYGKEHQE
jgi:succinyl-CoA synthetase beta subunit